MIKLPLEECEGQHVDGTGFCMAATFSDHGSVVTKTATFYGNNQCLQPIVADRHIRVTTVRG